MTNKPVSKGFGACCRRLAIGLLLLLQAGMAQAVDGQRPASIPSCAQIEDLAFAEDLYGSLSFSDITSQKFIPRWQATNIDALRFGYSEASYWLRLQLSSQPNLTECVLLVDNEILNHLDFYQVDQQGLLVQQFNTGNKTVFSSRAIAHRKFLFPIQAIDNQPTTLYLKISSSTSLTIPISILPAQDFFQSDQHHLLWLGVFVGCMLIMVLSNAVIYLMVRDTTYLYYIAYVVFATLSATDYMGLNFQYLWPDQPDVNGVILLVLINLLMFFLWTYVLSFIGRRKELKKTNVYFIVLRCLFVINALAALYFSFTGVIIFSFVLIVGGSIIGLVLGTPLVKQGDAPTRLLAIAFTGYFASFIVLGFSVAGWLPALVIFKYSIMVGLIFQVTLFSLAFGDRLKQANLKTQIAQNQLLENQRLDNISLEQRVQERTLLLDKANTKLMELSTIDGLTQIKNRSFFNGILEHEFKTAQRTHSSLAVILIDLDDFKKINDTHGHLAGDECLQAAAKTIGAIMQRPDDQLCRYGGEEFVVLLPNTDGVGAVAVAQRIRRAIASMRIPIAEAELALTTSLGVAYAVPKLAEKSLALVEQADQALYRAKHLGKNRVIEFSDLPEASE